LLRRFEREGWVDLAHQRVSIRDSQALRTLAGSQGTGSKIGAPVTQVTDFVQQRIDTPRRPLLDYQGHTMKTNEGTLDRILRIEAGLALLALTLTGTIGVWGWIGVVPLLTGAIGICPLYTVLGIRTCPVSNCQGANALGGNAAFCRCARKMGDNSLRPYHDGFRKPLPFFAALAPPPARAPIPAGQTNTAATRPQRHACA